MRKISLFLFFLLFGLYQLCGQSERELKEAYPIHRSWTYQSKEKALNYTIKKDIYQYFQNSRSHENNGFVPYVLSDFGRDELKKIADSLWNAEMSLLDNTMNVISFVQSFNYVSDSVSKGLSDYVRFPVETLVDGCGDCEDLVILAAAILYEMGHDELLLIFEEHLALAIKVEDEMPGMFYKYNGNRYYYLETTHVGWGLGDVPEKYTKLKAEICPVIKVPIVSIISYHFALVDSNNKELKFKVDFELKNDGPGIARNARLYLTAHPKTDDRQIYAEKFLNLGDLNEGKIKSTDFSFKVPNKNDLEYSVMVVGDNFEPTAISITKKD